MSRHTACPHRGRHEKVIALTALEPVIAAPTEQRVVASKTGDHVVAIGAVDPVDLDPVPLSTPLSCPFLVPVELPRPAAGPASGNLFAACLSVGRGYGLKGFWEGLGIGLGSAWFFVGSTRWRSGPPRRPRGPLRAAHARRRASLARRQCLVRTIGSAHSTNQLASGVMIPARRITPSTSDRRAGLHLDVGVAAGRGST